MHLCVRYLSTVLRSNGVINQHKPDRTLRFLIYLQLSLFAFLAIGACCLYAQTAKSVDTSKTREAEAETILRHSIEKLGGLQLWSTMKGLRAVGTVQDGEKSGQVAWEDHWDGHYKMVRHTKVGDNDNKYLQNPDHRPFSSNTPSSPPRKLRPEFDPISALTLHAPGAAIAMAINNPHYGLVVIHPQIKEAKDLDCVRIVKNSLIGRGGSAHVILCLTHDGMPKRAIIGLANVKTPEQALTETVEYSEYYSAQGDLFPEKIAVTTPLGRTRWYSFQSFIINPALDPVEFEEGAQ